MFDASFGSTRAHPSRAARRSGTVLAVNAAMRLADRVPPGACRFLVAGGLASLVNWLVRFPLSAGLPYGMAVAAAYAVGMVAGFGLYRSWVFPGSPLRLSSQLLRFCFVNMAGLSCVVIAAHVLVVLIGATGLASMPVAEALGHGAAIVIGAVVNFVGHRAITFARMKMVARVAARGGPR